MSANDLKDVHYDAFISYRHNEFDSFVASNIHKKLESFKLPKSVRPKVKSGKTKIERVFRDVDELPLSDNLSDPISKALANSDFLITICTPRYPQSRWCMKEIEEFLKTHPRDHVLVVLAEDEPVNSFPEILRFDEAGNEIEPLATDTRGKTKKEISKAIDGAVIKLCAAIFGLNYDDLKQRHREQRIKKLTAIFGSIGAAVLAFAIFATVMLVKISRQNVIISNQYDELQDKYAASMAATSRQLLESGKRMDAVNAAKSVMPETPDKAYNPEALSALYNSMGIYKISPGYFPWCAYEGDAWLDGYGVSYDQKYIYVYDRTSINVYDVESGDLVSKIDAPEGYGTITFCGSEGLLFNNDESVFYYPVSGGAPAKPDIPSDVTYHESPKGKGAIYFSDGKIYCTSKDGATVFATDVSTYLRGEGPCLDSVSDAGDNTLLCFSGTASGATFHDLVLLNEAGGSVVDTYQISTADDDISVDTLRITDEFVYFYGVFAKSNQATVIGRKSGQILGTPSYPDPIVASWEQADGLYFLLEDGSVYHYIPGAQSEKVPSFFDIKPGQEIAWADYRGDSIFCMFKGADYVTLYSNKISPYAKEASKTCESAVDADFADDILTDPLLDQAFYSNDKKYIYALFMNHTAKIYDAATLACVTDFAKADELFYDLRYSEVTGSYILTGAKSYILDSNMNVICVTNRIVCDDGDGFIMENEEGAQFNIPWIRLP